MNRNWHLIADAGEDPEALADGREERLYALLDAVSIACGGHAGDDASIRRCLELARRSKVAIGAHPSYPDRASFGRRSLALGIEQIEAQVCAQIERLGSLARESGLELEWVKPHGALYHDCSRDDEIAAAVARAAQRWSGSLALIGFAGSRALSSWQALGLETLAEAFVDRSYEADGSLRARDLPGALIERPESAALQAERIVRHGSIEVGGGVLRIEAELLCLHSDTPNAVEIASAVRGRLTALGISRVGSQLQ